MKNTVNVSELVIAHAYFIEFVLFIVLCFVMMGIFYVVATYLVRIFYIQGVVRIF